MSTQAYQKVQNANETPSQVEYRLFAQVTRALQDAAGLPVRDPAFMKALDWNRRLWSTLSTDCALSGNQLPDETRAAIISLGIWVSKHTTAVARGKEPLEPLISVNKTIMTGLSQQAKAQAKAQAAAASNTAAGPQQANTVL